MFRIQRFDEARKNQRSGMISFQYDGVDYEFGPSSFNKSYIEVYQWLYNKNFDFSQIKSVYNNYGSFYTNEEVLSSKYENRLFVKINDEKYLLNVGNKDQLQAHLNQNLIKFGAKDIKFDFSTPKSTDPSNDENVSSFNIKNYNQLFDEIKKASTDIYNCLTSTTYLCNKLNKIDKSYFQEYLDFLRVGPVNDLRRDVAAYLIDNNITPTILDEIIKKHKKEKPNQLRAWLNPYKILHPIINQEYKNFDEGMEILANEISKSNGGMKWKINNFNGPQNQGSENYWIAFYNKSLLSQANSLQLFISFKQGQCVYGIYKHNGTEYLVGPETYTDWESFSSFISENIHYILEDKKSSDEISPDSDEEDLEIPNRFTGIPQPFDIESELSRAQAQSQADSDIENFSKFRAVQNEEEDAINPFRQAICVLGRSGAGKSFTIDDILDNSEHEYEFIIPSASTTGLLSQFSPSAKDGRGGYIPSRLGKLIEKAYKNKGKLYTAVFDECHKSNIIEMINDELLQAISTERNKNRFISLDDETSDLYPSKVLDKRGNIQITDNLGFIFISSNARVISGNEDFFNRVDLVEITKADRDLVKTIKDLDNKRVKDTDEKYELVSKIMNEAKR